MSEGPLPREADLCPKHFEEHEATPGCCRWCDLCLEPVREDCFDRHQAECGRPSIRPVFEADDVELGIPVS